jgi:hypothetical protein
MPYLWFEASAKLLTRVASIILAMHSIFSVTEYDLFERGFMIHIVNVVLCALRIWSVTTTLYLGLSMP